MTPHQEAIKQRMEETRSSLQDKLETLEQQVKSTVEEATSAVTDTVQTVKEVVTDTVSTVKGSVEETVETVKATFDVRLQVERHPWPMIAGAAAAGFVTGRLLDRLMPPLPRMSYQPGSNGHAAGLNGMSTTSKMATRMEKAAEPNPPPAPEPPRVPEPPRPSLLEKIASHYGDELSKLKGLAIATVAGLVREMVVSEMAPALKDKVTEIVDGVTRKMGAEPIRGPILKHAEDREHAHAE
jgi:ElaB/YqjD/DUF883 family membrane-anchored ribosome-binding protein